MLKKQQVIRNKTRILFENQGLEIPTVNYIERLTQFGYIIVYPNDYMKPLEPLEITYIYHQKGQESEKIPYTIYLGGEEPLLGDYLFIITILDEQKPAKFLRHPAIATVHYNLIFGEDRNFYQQLIEANRKYKFDIIKYLRDEKYRISCRAILIQKFDRFVKELFTEKLCFYCMIPCRDVESHILSEMHGQHMRSSNWAKSGIIQRFEDLCRIRNEEAAKIGLNIEFVSKTDQPDGRMMHINVVPGQELNLDMKINFPEMSGFKFFLQTSGHRGSPIQSVDENLASIIISLQLEPTPRLFGSVEVQTVCVYAVSTRTKNWYQSYLPYKVRYQDQEIQEEISKMRLETKQKHEKNARKPCNIVKPYLRPPTEIENAAMGKMPIMNWKVSISKLKLFEEYILPQLNSILSIEPYRKLSGPEQVELDKELFKNNLIIMPTDKIQIQQENTILEMVNGQIQVRDPILESLRSISVFNFPLRLIIEIAMEILSKSEAENEENYISFKSVKTTGYIDYIDPTVIEIQLTEGN